MSVSSLSLADCQRSCRTARSMNRSQETRLKKLAAKLEQCAGTSFILTRSLRQKRKAVFSSIFNHLRHVLPPWEPRRGSQTRLVRGSQ
jgi:hypothetical protein